MNQRLTTDLALSLRLIERQGIVGIAALSVAGLAYLPLFAMMRLLKSAIELASFRQFTIARRSVTDSIIG